MLFRYSVLGFSAVAILLGSWMAATDWIPVGGSETGAGASETQPVSAWTLFPREESWAEAASARAQTLWNMPTDERIDKSRAMALRSLSERALLLGPHDSEQWLILAEVARRAGEPRDKVAAPLQMSYYTAPNESALFAKRQLVAVTSDAFKDDMLKDLLRDDLRRAARKDDMKPAIEAAYRAASPQAKEFILGSLDQFAPDFRSYLQASP